MAKKRVQRSRVRRKPASVMPFLLGAVSVEGKNDKLFEGLGRTYYMELERNSLELEAKYNDLRDRLIRLLNASQIEAAAIAGCSPEVYALEWIEIYIKDKLREIAPGFGGYLFDKVKPGMTGGMLDD